MLPKKASCELAHPTTSGGLALEPHAWISPQTLMTPERALPITATLAIPLAELRFQFSRSGGPGGQHVNRSETQVELTFDVAGSPSLNEEQRARVRTALKSYIDGRGILHLTAQTTRSQHRNRAEVLARFQRLMQQALRLPKRRRPTRPPPQAKEQRLAAKRHRSAIKARRTRSRLEDE
jgi:ribosome-associated protein